MWRATTIAKSPPPPRSAQNRSGSLSASTVRASPSAVTSSIARTRLQANPYWRPNQLRPPPRWKPAMPTSGEEPGRPLSPCCWAASASSTESTPASARAVPAAASTSMPRIRSVLIRIAPSSEPRATAPWPVPWPETRSPLSAAKRTTAAMSSPLSTKATALGRWSAARFQPIRAWSQSESVGVAIRPAIASPLKSVTAVSFASGVAGPVHRFSPGDEDLAHHIRGKKTVGGNAGIALQPRRQRRRVVEAGAAVVGDDAAVGAARDVPQLHVGAEPLQGRGGAEAEQLQRYRPGELLDRLARVADDDEALDRRGDDLLAQVGAAAALDQPAVGRHLVGAVDRDVEMGEAVEVLDRNPQLTRLFL